jgi:mRNA-degrading endonuclease RelE of RelBE toxin-antitoxin system
LPTIIDQTCSQNFLRQLKALQKKYRRAGDDVAGALSDISKARKTAHSANAVPGYDQTVWKYRCGSSDMKRGSRGGFRIMARYYAESDTLVPFTIYTHDQYENQPPEGDIKAWLKQLVAVAPHCES